MWKLLIALALMTAVLQMGVALSLSTATPTYAVGKPATRPDACLNPGTEQHVPQPAICPE